MIASFFQHKDLSGTVGMPAVPAAMLPTNSITMMNKNKLVDELNLIGMAMSTPPEMMKGVGEIALSKKKVSFDISN